MSRINSPSEKPAVEPESTPVVVTGPDLHHQHSIGDRDQDLGQLEDEDTLSDPAARSAPLGPEPDSEMRPLYWLFGLCAVPHVAGAAVPGDAAASLKAKPLPPSQDPWYTAPHGFENKRPGDILRIRPAPGNLTKVVDQASVAVNILYRTTDARHKPSWAVTTLFIPHKFKFSPSHKAALLSYQFAYNTVNLDSSPSIGLYWRLAQEDPHLGLKSDAAFLSKMLSMGWILNVPDFEGPLAAFGASVQAGHATLDSLRAVESLSSLTGGSKLNIAMWGYSGGTIGTLAAAEMQSSYAPELEIAGTAVGGLVDNLAADLDNLNKSPIAGTMLSYLLGITQQFPCARKYLVSRLVPETKADFLNVINVYVSDTVRKYSGQDMYKFFKGGAEDLKAPIMQKLFKQQSLAGFKGVPEMPMFVYKAIGDEYVPIVQTDATVKRFCEAGADITFERNTIGEHVSEIENGKPRALAWLASIFDETYKPNKSGCTIRNVTVQVPA